jgi:hypothetical protein
VARQVASRDQLGRPGQLSQGQGDVSIQGEYHQNSEDEGRRSDRQQNPDGPLSRDRVLGDFFLHLVVCRIPQFQGDRTDFLESVLLDSASKPSRVLHLPRADQVDLLLARLAVSPDIVPQLDKPILELGRGIEFKQRNEGIVD